MSADFDFDTLWEDYDTVVALESRGRGIEDPMVRTIAKRWGVLDSIEQEHVAQESRAMMERAQEMADAAVEGKLPTRFVKKSAKIAAKGVAGAAKLSAKGVSKGAKAAGVGVGAVSVALAGKFKEWASHYGPKFKAKLYEMAEKAPGIEKKRRKLEQKLNDTKTLAGTPIKTLTWVSCVCLLDKVDLDACIWLANHTADLDSAVKSYTIKVRQFEGALTGRYQEQADGTLSKLGYGSNAAIHRASGILGRFTQNDVKARPLAGNVFIVNHGKGVNEKIEFGVGREAKLRETIDPLTHDQCKKALEAVGKLAKALEARGAHHGVFSYTGIYKEMEEMQDNMEGMEGEELRAAMLLYKNAMAMEDAFTTAMARVSDGLLNWVSASLKG